jgi:hypothetical protein
MLLAFLGRLPHEVGIDRLSKIVGKKVQSVLHKILKRGEI